MDAKLGIEVEQKQPRLKMDFSLAIQNMRFESPGQYAISILVSGEEKASIPLAVAQRPSTSEEGQ